MDEARNPYAPGAGSAPPELVGRSELLEAFSISLARLHARRPTKSLMPVGLRGVGKTVLLNRFVELAKGLGFCTEAMEASSEGTFVHALAVHLRRILLQLDRAKGVNERVKRALAILKGFSVKAGLEGLSLHIDIDPIRGLGDSGDLTLDLTDVFVALGEAARSEETAVLIAIDEVQYLREGELSAIIMALHRCAQLSLPLTVVATGLPQIAGLAGNAKSYSERLFDFPDIGALNARDVRDAIVLPAKRQGVEFEEPALERLYELTRGYPYFVQEWAYRVWNHAAATPITLADVNGAEPDVLRRLDESFFRVRFDRLTPREKRYMRAMAELGDGPHRSGDIASALGSKVEHVATVRGALIRKGMIYSPQHGDTAFTVPLFNGFMLRMMPAVVAGNGSSERERDERV